jgi:hypothetical protein
LIIEEGGNGLSTSKTLKITALLLELLLAVPILGGIIVMGTSYFALIVMFILHILALVFAVREGSSKLAPIGGIITSGLAWIPILGWLLHVVTFVLYLVDVLSNRKQGTIQEQY